MAAPLPNTWPNSKWSRIVKGPVHHWHVQEAGNGPRLLLLHGAGGSLHSFRDLLPLLADRFHVLAPDLPGHGFTRLGAQQRSGLRWMAQDIEALCDTLDFAPEVILGHSAGAAIALQIARNRPGIRVIGVNAALDKFEGIAGILFPAMAKMLAAMPFTARLFSGASARPDRIRALITSTGSKIDEEGLALYRHLIGREAHVNGALSMMAQWRLDELLAALPEIQTPTLFMVGARDQTVPPKVSHKAAHRMPQADLRVFDDYGHLVHEEVPDDVFSACLEFLDGNHATA